MPAHSAALPKPIEIVCEWRDLPERLRGAVVAMGVFDGVHLGHQAVIAQAAKVARELNAPLAVLTFDPAPKAFFNPDRACERLMDSSQFESALSALGVERIYLLPMKELSHVSSADFAQQVLRDGLQVRHVAVGFDNTFGCDRAGPEAMAAYGVELGFTTSVAAEVIDGSGAKICSTAVRQALRAGALEDAERALGRVFSIRGDVSAQTDAAYKLTFGDYIAPRPGAYAVRTRLADGVRLGLADITERTMDVRLADGDFSPAHRVIETELVAYLGAVAG
ncbi:adenylyltransferase/cytidyltransferase family protein [Phenylobacterium immobile]|uniref:adenylyltransferase/cytidyltransferase family protein n=1 Tax=Phenylobacterium immobile TaxID=21 RepID=UPI000B1EED38|nr:adenylyltransferase/cytidyltransferase family protein [Phenylobacterium immobile]